jgi:Concanavalin A-like lectin/glucanases superfamily
MFAPIIPVQTRSPIWRPTFLLHMNGTDGSTTFTESMAGLTASVSGNAQIDTAQSKFGGASALFDGTGDGISFAIASSIDVDNEFFFTIECWVRIDTAVAGNGVVLRGVSGTGNYPYEFWYDNSTTKLGIRGVYSNSSTWGWQTSGAITKGQWYHMAMTRSGATIKAYIDGVVIGTTSAVALPLFACTTMWIGMSSTGSGPLKGWIDEVRIVKGRAVYNGAFTSPTAEFTDHP